MRTTITVTSKRQVTIPKKLWEQLRLDGVRYLQAEVEGDKLRLQKVDFSTQMDKFWGRTASAVRGELSDTSIKHASREARRHRPIK